MKQLFTNQAANGQSAVITWVGGRGLLQASGTWGGGTIVVQLSPDGGTTWLNISASLSANGSVAFEAPATKLRLDLSGATTPTLNAWVGYSESH